MEFSYYNDNAKNGADHFVVEDLLDLPNDDADTSLDATLTPNSSTDSSAVIHHSQMLPPADARHFSTDFPVPYEELAELEWLSNFVEESFSSNEMQLIEGMKSSSEETQHQFIPDPNRASVPAKARSKRSRGNWASRLLLMSPPTNTSSSSAPPKKKESQLLDSTTHEARKCLHCATDKTPQWRTGPMGPKTLCNACGVRYKSGRLVPEYRPAASPTFVLTKHSNSHRKVLEIRRQKEFITQPQQFIHHNMSMFDADDYFIHQHLAPDFRHLI